MSIYGMRRFTRVVASCIPDHELLVVGDGSEEALVKEVPSNVLDNGRVTGEDGLCINDPVFFWRSVYVP